MSQNVQRSVHSSPFPNSPAEDSEDSDEFAACCDADAPGASYCSMPLHMAGTEIIELRQSVGWSQSDLAAHIAYSQRQVSRWERGQQLVSQEACAAIMRAVAEAHLSMEAQRLSRYQLRRWMRGLHDATHVAMSKLGLV